MARKREIDEFGDVFRLNVADSAFSKAVFATASKSGYSARISSETSILTKSTV